MRDKKTRKAKKALRVVDKRISRIKGEIKSLKREKAGHEAALNRIYHTRDQALVFEYLCKKLEHLFSIEGAVSDGTGAREDAKLYLTVEKAWKNGPIPISADGATYYETQTRIEKPILSRFVYQQDYDTFTDENVSRLLCLFTWNERARLAELKQLSTDDLEDCWNTFTAITWMTTSMMHVGRVFRISSQLAHTFALADVSIGAEFFRLPFQTVLLVLPSGFKVEMNNSYLRAVNATVVLDEPTPNGEATLTVAVGTTDAPTLLYRVQLGRKKTIHEDILHYQTEMDERATRVAKLTTNQYDDPVYRILTTIVNTFLYCTSFPDQVEAHNQEVIDKLNRRSELHPPGSKKRRRSETKLRQQKSSSVYIVGKHFQLDDPKCREQIESGLTIRARHIVRGHWRNQACGIDWQDRKLIFIQPFWKGSGGDEIRKDYIAK